MSANLDKPAVDYKAITPSDSVPLDPPARFFWVVTAGNLTIESEAGNEETFAVSVGVFPFGAKFVKATGTTATVKAAY